MLGSWWNLFPGASLCTNYCISVGISPVGLHCFNVTAGVGNMQARPTGASSIFAVIAAGDAVRGLLH